MTAPPPPPSRPCAMTSAAPNNTAPAVAIALRLFISRPPRMRHKPRRRGRDFTYAIRGSPLRKPEREDARARRHRHQLALVEHVRHRRRLPHLTRLKTPQ